MDIQTFLFYLVLRNDAAYGLSDSYRTKLSDLQALLIINTTYYYHIFTTTCGIVDLRKIRNFTDVHWHREPDPD